MAVASMFGAPFADRRDVWSLETLTRELVETGTVPVGVRWIAIDNNRFGTLGRVLVNRHGFRLVGIASGRLALFEDPADPDAAPAIRRVSSPARKKSAPNSAGSRNSRTWKKSSPAPGPGM